MAFLNSKTQEEESKVKRNKEVDEEPDEQPDGGTGGDEDDRPDYQLLFMSSWLLGDYWTFVWKTFGLDGPKAWEGGSQTFATLKMNLSAFNFFLRLLPSPLFAHISSRRLHPSHPAATSQSWLRQTLVKTFLGPTFGRPLLPLQPFGQGPPGHRYPADRHHGQLQHRAQEARLQPA